MLGSRFDGEIANLGREASELLRQHGLQWRDMIVAPTIATRSATALKGHAGFRLRRNRLARRDRILPRPARPAPRARPRLFGVA